VIPFTSTPYGRSLALVFEAAEQNIDHAPTTSTTAALAGYQGDVLRRRVQQAVNNDGMVSAGVADLRDGLRGPMALHSSDKITRERLERWSRAVGWGMQFGTLAQVWARVAHEVITSGEVYVERIQVQTANARDNGLRLRVWGIGSVARDKGVDGHAFDEQGVYAGTYFRGEAAESSRATETGKVTFVADANVSPIRVCYEASAAWGYPLPAPALKGARMLDSLALAELGQAQLDASTQAIGLIEQPALFGQSALTGAASTLTDVDGNVIDEIIPNTFMVARGFKDIKTLTRDTRVIDYGNSQARVAAGMRSTVERIGGAMGSASFSALRGASDQRRRIVSNLDKDSGLDFARAELVDWYVEAELLAGFVVDKATLSWLEVERETANDLQTVKALALEREMGWIDDETAILMRGRVPDVVRGRLANEPAETPEIRRARMTVLQGGIE